MAEGIRATITADTTSFVQGAKAAAAAADQFKASVKGAAKPIRDFPPMVDSALPPLKKFGGAAKQTTKNFRAMKGATQQLGFQIQDIAVQLQGGTNALTVFGQQGSQIAGIFGPGGAVIGAVLAVAAAIGTALVGSLGAATEKTSELVKETNELLEAMLSISLLDLNDRLFEQAQVVDKVRDSLAAVTLKIKEQEAATTKGSDVALAGAFARLNALKAESKELGTLLRLEESKARLLSAEQSKLVQAGRPGGLGVAPTGEDDAAANAAKLAAALKAGEDNDAIVRQFRESEREAAMAHQLQLATIEQEALQASRDRMRDFLEGRRGMVRHDADAIARLVENSMGRQKAITVGALASILKSGSAHSKKVFKLNKIAGIANAGIAGWEAATDAWKFGMKTGGPPLAAAFTAASLATTFAQIQQLRATSFGSGGGAGGGGVASSPAAATPAAAPAADPTLVNITLEGEVFGRDQVRSLIGQINEAVDDGFKLRFT